MCASSQLGLQLQHDGLQLLLLLLALDRQLLHFGSQTLVLCLHVLQLGFPQANQLLQVTLFHSKRYFQKPFASIKFQLSAFRLTFWA